MLSEEALRMNKLSEEFLRKLAKMYSLRKQFRNMEN